MALSISAVAYPGLADARDLFRKHYRFSAEIIDRAYALFGDEWADRFEEALRALFPTPDSLSAAVRGYAAFAMTSIRLQAKFDKTGEYPAKTYAEAAAEVYHNEEYMQTEYLPGLFLSHYLWAHHYHQIRFFETAFVDWLKISEAKNFVEVGIGTGLYSRITLQALPEITGVGLDISESSKRFTEKQIGAFGFEGRYQISLEDVTTGTRTRSAESVVCVEVLEHLEDPVEFLRALRRILVSGGKAFITAALNAAHSDHIYLYRRASEVEAHLKEAGFVTEQYFVGQAYAPREGIPAPLAVAFVVS